MHVGYLYLEMHLILRQGLERVAEVDLTTLKGVATFATKGGDKTLMTN